MLKVLLFPFALAFGLMFFFLALPFLFVRFLLKLAFVAFLIWAIVKASRAARPRRLATLRRTNSTCAAVINASANPTINDDVPTSLCWIAGRNRS